MLNTMQPSRMMTYRSFMVSSSNAEPRKVSSIHRSPSIRGPICFVIPGIGCQIDNMIEPFMSLRPFRESVEDSISIIDPNGTKRVREILIKHPESCWKIFALEVFQIAVVDTLRSMGVTPDLIVGHSFGEFCCGYADGFMSKAEVLDVCYSLAQIISNNASRTSKKHLMISVNLTWAELSSLIPSNIYPACFNSIDNCTLAGPKEEVDKLSKFLSSRGIHYRVIDTDGFAFHTPALGIIIDQYRAKLHHYADVYRVRSNRWIVSHETSMNLNTKINLQAFLVELMQNNVNFVKACESIPVNAVCIEISPRKFMASLLKSNLSESTVVAVPFKIDKQLTSYVDSNNKNHQLSDSFLSSLGNLHINGINLNLESIFYDQLTSPAPIETPFLSPLIKLDHSVPRLVRRFPEHFNTNHWSHEKFTIDIGQKGKQHLGCFYYNGHRAVPFAGLLYTTWSKFASLTAHKTDDLSVCLEKIKLHQLLVFDDQTSTSVTLKVTFLPTLDDKYKFTLTSTTNSAKIMTGYISALGDYYDGNLTHDRVNYICEEDDYINRDIFYGILSRSGLHYQDDLCNVISIDNRMSGIMENNQDWIVRVESLLQLASFSNNQEKPKFPYHGNRCNDNIPVRLEEVHCVPLKSDSSKQSTVTMLYDKFSDIVQSESIYIRGVHFGSFSSLAPLQFSPIVTPCMETFIPRFNVKAYQPMETCITIIFDQLIDLNGHLPTQSGITLISSKDNATPDLETLVDVVKRKLTKRRFGSPFNLIEIDSLNELINDSNRSKLDKNRLDEVEVTKPITETRDSYLLIYQSDQSNLNLTAESPVVVSSNVDFIIVLQRAKIAIDGKKGQNEAAYNDKYFSNDCLNDYLTNVGLVIVSCHLSDQGYLYLIRRSLDPVILNIKTININSIESLVDIDLSTFIESTSDQFWFIVNNLSSSIGLSETWRLKDQQQRIKLKWLVKETNNLTDNCHSDSKHEYDQIKSIGLTYSYLRDGAIGSLHFLPIRSSPLQIGHLDDVILNQVLSLLRPSFASVALCFNQIDYPTVIGFSGALDDRSAKFGLISYDSYTRCFSIIANWIYNEPKWSLEEASTIPLPYYLAYYAIIVTGHLQPGETVLIINGHSSVGLAILNITKVQSSKVYLTVETKDEMNWVKRHFPWLEDYQFFITSDNLDIDQTIKASNNGQGCDLVVNTSVYKLNRTGNNVKNNNNNNSNSCSQVKGNLNSILNCLTIGGRCVDLNKSPMSTDDNLGLDIFLKNIAYYGSTPEGLFRSSTSAPTATLTSKGNSQNLHKMISDSVAKGLADGSVCSPIYSDLVNAIKFDISKHQTDHMDKKSRYKSSKLPATNLIIGQPGDIELEIIEKCHLNDSKSHFILLPVNLSPQYMTFSSPPTSSSSVSIISSCLSPSPSSSSSSVASSSNTTTNDLSPISSSSKSLSPSTRHPQPPSLVKTIPSSSSIPSSPSSPDYHPYIINQLQSFGCSFVNIASSIVINESLDNIAQYHKVLKDISHGYTIDKVFLVYRGSNQVHFDPTSQHQTHKQQQQQQLGGRLMVKLLDQIIDEKEFSINSLALISCSLSQDTYSSFNLWPQLVRKCQQYGQRTGVPSVTVDLTDLLPPKDPNYWFQLDHCISQLYYQLIATVNSDDNNNNDNNNGDTDRVNSAKEEEKGGKFINRVSNGVYKLTSKLDDN